MADRGLTCPIRTLGGPQSQLQANEMVSFSDVIGEETVSLSTLSVVPGVRHFTTSDPAIEYFLHTPQEPQVEGTVGVLVPGANHTAAAYEPFGDALMHCGVPTAVMNLRGHGGSGLPTARTLRSMRRADFIADIGAVIADLQAKKVVLIGHSLGGYSAWGYVEEHPVDGLVLLDSTTPGGWPSAYARLMWWLISHGQVGQVIDTMRMRGRNFSNEFTRKRVLLSSKQCPQYAADPETVAFLNAGYQEQEAAAIAFDLLTRAKPLMTKRLLFVVGKEDIVIPARSVQKRARGYLGSEVELIEGPHNLFMTGNSEQAAKRIATFVFDVDRGAVADGAVSA